MVLMLPGVGTNLTDHPSFPSTPTHSILPTGHTLLGSADVVFGESLLTKLNARVFW